MARICFPYFKTVTDWQHFDKIAKKIKLNYF